MVMPLMIWPSLSNQYEMESILFLDEAGRMLTPKAGTMEEVVESLVPAFPDKNISYLDTFPCTYQVFITTQQVLDQLSHRSTTFLEIIMVSRRVGGMGCPGLRGLCRTGIRFLPDPSSARPRLPARAGVRTQGRALCAASPACTDFTRSQTQPALPGRRRPTRSSRAVRPDVTRRRTTTPRISRAAPLPLPFSGTSLFPEVPGKSGSPSTPPAALSGGGKARGILANQGCTPESPW
ncbi:hypothetical protein HPG69_012005 [Diceros bicornis minor]|uniref:N-terminal Ras-GEF domain-containing protein n=1 Tax=Diceros bicornis minor TaxID=77932 RepID=A0A7J7EI00_DICBM|nr:hypothetical protein HPG69_012005 [Diceros bicornis minor]